MPQAEIRTELDPRRANLLRPLELVPGTRALVLGTGVGALARFLAERGLEVVGIAADEMRARAAQAHCADLAHVEIVPGTIDELSRGARYDLVICVAGSSPSEKDHEGLLRALRAQTNEDGHLVLAMENQLALRALLGYPLDAQALNWAAIEGFRCSQPRCALSRRQLSALLRDHGFAAQSWLFPYPNHILPRTILAETILSEPDAEILVDQLVRSPVEEQDHGTGLLCDDRAAHRAFLAAGLGRDVANAFLVVATREGGPAAPIAAEVRAWHFDRGRLALWQRQRVIEASAGTQTVRSVRLDDGTLAERGWLQQRFEPIVPFTCGPTLEQLLHDACAEANLDAVGSVIQRWHHELERHATLVMEPSKDLHPFYPEASAKILPGHFLDCSFDNFVLSSEDELVFVDAEWKALGGVDIELVMCRTLWYAAEQLITTGAKHPWSEEVTVEELTVSLGALADIAVTADLLVRFTAAEAALQHLVTGADRDQVTARIRKVSALSRHTLPHTYRVPLTRLHEELQRAHERNGQQDSDSAHGRAAEGFDALRGELASLTAVVAQLEQQTGFGSTAAEPEQDKAEARAKQAEVEREAILQHLARLQRAALNVVSSRRWIYGNVAGNLYGRMRRQPDRKEQRLRELIKEGQRLLKRHGSEDGTSSAPRTRGRLPSSAYAYNNFEQFLNYALLNPIMRSPFTEVDRQILGVMDDERRRRLSRCRDAAPVGLVSIVMATYDRRAWLPNALESVLAQSYADWELVLVDDGSTDGTSELVEQYEDPRIVYQRLARNHGVARARNVGLEACRGAFITYLDSDNTWDPDYLLLMVHALAEAEEVDATYCAQEVWETRIDRSGESLRTMTGVRFAPFNRSLLENRNYVDLNAFLHRRSLYETLGGFNEKLRRLVDWDLVLRYSAGVMPLALPCLLSHYELGGAGNQITNTESWLASLQVIDQSLHSRPLSIALPQPPPKPAFSITTTPARPRYRRPVTIVIPSFEAADYLRAAIASVERYTPDDHRLVIVDNGSGGQVRNLLRRLADHDKATVALNEGNLGFTYAVNRGIALSDPESDIILLNNDALVTEGWLEALWEVFDLVPEAGLVIPRQTLFPDTRSMQDHVPFAMTRRELDVTLSLHHGNVLDAQLYPRRGLVELSFAPFFCVYIPRSTLENVGPLDAENGPHFRSDRLYCDVVRRHAKKKIVYTPHSKLYHFLQQSTQQLKRLDPEHHRRIYVDNDWKSIKAAVASGAESA